MSEGEFVNNMNEHIGTRPIRLIFAQLLGISFDVVEDEDKFLILLYGLYEQFVQLQEDKNIEIEDDSNKAKVKDCKRIFRDIKKILFHSQRDINKTDIYENILKNIINIIPYYFIPCVLDINWRVEHVVTDGGPDEEKCLEFFGIPKTEGTENDIRSFFAKEVYKILNKNKNECFDTLQKDLVKFFYGKCQCEKNNEKTCDGNLEKYSIEQIAKISHEDALKEFSTRFNDENFKEKLQDSLVRIEGFFDLKEFDFLLKEDPKENVWKEHSLVEFVKKSKEEASNNKEKEMIISKCIVDILGNIYKKIIDAVKEFCGDLCMQTDYNKTNRKEEFCFKLDNMHEKDILTLQKCLKVTRDGSLTGIIKNVIIQDKVSDLYAVILDKLGINRLTIVDTCGLDHVTIWNEEYLRKQIERLYTDYVKRWEIEPQSKKDLMMETGVLYIKKLDSGKPDELNSILPVVRKIIPSIPMYCVFSGIDIFYRTEQEIDNILWKKSSTNCPKAVRYILENDMGMQDITDVNAYKVLKNNLIPFCGDEKLVSTKFAYYKNNVSGVRKLLTSIAMKESSSLEIIDQSFVDEINNSFDKKIEEIIRRMFEIASLDSSRVWWNTKNADIKSFFRDGKLGYDNTYNHMFYFLFHNGYVTAIREKSNLLFGEGDVKCKSAVIAALYNMENNFLGINDNLVDVGLDDSKKNRFRKIIEEMYKGKEDNPFSEEYAKKHTDEYIRNNRDKIFGNVFEFTKYLNVEVDGNTISQKLVKLFKNTLLEQIKIDNNHKVTYLVRMNDGLVEELDKVKKEFCEKYGDKDSEGKEMFETFMKYYFASSNS